MILDSINYWGVLAAVVVNMAVGALWYSKLLFGPAWMKSVGLTEDDIKDGNKAMVFAGVLSVLIAFFMAVVLQWVGPPDHGGSGLGLGLIVGFAMWLGFSGPTLFIHLIFHQGTGKQYLINGGNYLVAQTLMGGVLGAIQWGM
ncbi:MAG: DUF1761 domain-containing protein [Alphaproteobacteria bacterium]